MWNEACGEVCNGSTAFLNLISCNCFACAALRLIKLPTWHSFDSTRIREQSEIGGRSIFECVTEKELLCAS